MNWGPTTANGAVWIKESIPGNTYSEPFLFAGWNYRTSWLKNDGEQDVTFTFEIDKEGKNQWKELKQINVTAGNTAFIEFSSSEKGEWIRVKSDKATIATVSFNYSAKEKSESTKSSQNVQRISPCGKE